MPAADPSRPGRRGLLLGIVATVPGLLSGCGIRLEDDAPRVPLVPVRTPVPAEEALVAVTTDCARLADLAADTGGPLAADLAVLHRRQVTVLRTALLQRGVPEDDLTPAPSPTTTSGPAPSPTASPGGGRAAALAAAEVAATSAPRRFTGVEDDLRVVVAALLAQRYAAATLLGATAPATGRRSAADTWPEKDADAVGDLVHALDAAVYFLQVAAARSTGRRRERAASTLGALRTLRADVADVVEPDGPALGHPLPRPVEGPADVERLVRETLVDLRASVAGASGDLLRDASPDRWAAFTRCLGSVEVEAHRWKVALSPFPGLT